MFCLTRNARFKTQFNCIKWDCYNVSINFDHIPHPSRWGGTLSFLMGMGYPIILHGVPPCSDLGWGYPLSWPEIGVPPILTWDPIRKDGVPPSQRDWIEYLPPPNWQTENSTFPHPSDADGNNCPIRAHLFLVLFWLCLMFMVCYFYSNLSFSFKKGKYPLERRHH